MAEIQNLRCTARLEAWEIAATACSSMRKAIELKNSIEATLSARVDAGVRRKDWAACRTASACCGTSAVSSRRRVSRIRASGSRLESAATTSVTKGTRDKSAL